MTKKLTAVQISVLKALLPNKKMFASPSNDVDSIGFFGYIDKQKKCREVTWRSLLDSRYIKAIDSFVFVITDKGKRELAKQDGLVSSSPKKESK